MVEKYEVSKLRKADGNVVQATSSVHENMMLTESLLSSGHLFFIHRATAPL